MSMSLPTEKKKADVSMRTPLLRRFRRLLMRMRRNWQIYLFMLLPLIYLFVFKYQPMYGAQIAFRRYSPRFGIWDSPWVGLAQFEKFFNSYQFERVITNTIRLAFYSLIAGFPLPVLLALMMNSTRSKGFRSLVENVTYMPHFISTVVMVGMMMQFFNVRTGSFSALYTFLTGQKMVDVMSIPDTFPHMYVWSGVWQSTGWASVSYIATLAGVSPELHEAAIVDGATKMQRILHVDFPVIIPTAIILLILNCGNVMNLGFEKVYLMQTSPNLAVSEIISTYVYKIGLQGQQYSYASAIGLFNNAINFVILIAVNQAARRLGETSLW